MGVFGPCESNRRCVERKEAMADALKEEKKGPHTLDLKALPQVSHGVLCLATKGAVPGEGDEVGKKRARGRGRRPRSGARKASAGARWDGVASSLSTTTNYY
jgi:hypothetical protein